MCVCVCVCVCVEGECSELRVVEVSEPSIVFSVERETAAVMLHGEVDRRTTTTKAQFVMFDVVADCSSSTRDNFFTVARTQVNRSKCRAFSNECFTTGQSMFFDHLTDRKIDKLFEI